MIELPPDLAWQIMKSAGMFIWLLLKLFWPLFIGIALINIISILIRRRRKNKKINKT